MRDPWLGYRPLCTRHSSSPSTIVNIIVILLTKYPRQKKLALEVGAKDIWSLLPTRVLLLMEY